MSEVQDLGYHNVTMVAIRSSWSYSNLLRVAKLWIGTDNIYKLLVQLKDFNENIN